MRLALLLALAVSLAACLEGSEPEPYTDGPVPVATDLLLARLDIRSLDAAFARLAAAGYTAEVVETHSTDDAPDAVVFRETVAVQGDEIRVVEISNPSLGIETPFAAFDPVARLLPKEPPFQNAATRELYETSSRRLPDSTVAVALANRTGDEMPIARVAVAVDTVSGQVVEAQVVRASTSAVYEELSNAYVRLHRRDGTWWPAEGELLTQTDVPFAERRRLRIAWRVLTVGGTPLDTPLADTLSADAE